MTTTTQLLLGIGIGAAVGIGVAMIMNTPDSIVENIPSSSDSDSVWITWLQDLSGRFSQSDANAIFIAALKEENPTNVDTSNFRQALSTAGISYTGTIIDTIEDDTSSAVHGIGSTISGIFGMGKILTYVVIGGGVLAVILISVSLFKHPEVTREIVSTAAKV